MTLIEAVSRIDDRKHNTYTQEDKIGWLSQLDGMVVTQLLETHEGEPIPFLPYSTDTDVETVLLVEAPFDDIYLRWLELQIDYANGEITRYNNASALFNAAWARYEEHFHRTHRPKGRGKDFH